MSKASNYADRVKGANEAPKPFSWREGAGQHDRHGSAMVAKDGWLWISHCQLPPKQALDLADWLYETFGEAGNVETGRPKARDVLQATSDLVNFLMYIQTNYKAKIQHVRVVDDDAVDEDAHSVDGEVLLEKDGGTLRIGLALKYERDVPHYNYFVRDEKEMSDLFVYEQADSLDQVSSKIIGEIQSFKTGKGVWDADNPNAAWSGDPSTVDEGFVS